MPMPKIGVSTLRWLLMGANLTLIGLTAYVAATFFGFVGKRDEITERLTDVASLKVVVPRTPPVTNYGELVAKLQEKKPVQLPVTPTAPTVPVIPEELSGGGGPLSTWKILNVIIGPTPEKNVAFLGVAQQETTGLAPPGPPRRTTPGRTRTIPSRARNLRAPSANQATPTTAYVRPGKELDGCIITHITDNPQRVYYREGDQPFFLEREEVESTIQKQVVDGGLVWVLGGLTATTDPNAPPLPGTQIDARMRGSIEPIPTQGAQKPLGAAPRPTPPTRVTPETRQPRNQAPVARSGSSELQEMQEMLNKNMSDEDRKAIESKIEEYMKENTEIKESKDGKE